MRPACETTCRNSRAPGNAAKPKEQVTSKFFFALDFRTTSESASPGLLEGPGRVKRHAKPECGIGVPLVVGRNMRHARWVAKNTRHLPQQSDVVTGVFGHFRPAPPTSAFSRARLVVRGAFLGFARRFTPSVLAKAWAQASVFGRKGATRHLLSAVDAGREWPRRQRAPTSAEGMVVASIHVLSTRGAAGPKNLIRPPLLYREIDCASTSTSAASALSRPLASPTTGPRKSSSPTRAAVSSRMEAREPVG